MEVKKTVNNKSWKSYKFIQGIRMVGEILWTIINIKTEGNCQNRCLVYKNHISFKTRKLVYFKLNFPQIIFYKRK